ncbi:bifunctional precorrin-2 dehydrogenase/sirohydrochlorin ferrochelatase [Tissierella sp. MB52-C2]|uniref:precorrin-2 dehydrogenase/sirohydrochlorin ferrochelatase family protein n=1 Tax=Tissierella sp. MB52-C2 TaxID=3070999 RepID=UPI00280AB917|nr:bifunctional precorrin-2 dehydrogenase/sirohydrochlorin ferrochelatase [Tissierella sp. MB52-C2]WMM23871.1 bifunctional precorrin-2 dehydrogenase/sirohydrochlorin ferrochelatase [Tissierella sp. MB52-C2]
MFYPIMLKIENKLIIVVGGGQVAYRKVKKLLEFGGTVRVVSPKIIDDFKDLQKEYKENIELIYDIYNKKYIEDAFLVIGATSSRMTNKEIGEDCNNLNILVNIVDSKDESDFITSSIINNDNLTISISTLGSFPYLSKKIRIDMEKKYKKFDKEYMIILEEIRRITLDNYSHKTKEIMDKALELNIVDLKEFLKELEK